MGKSPKLKYNVEMTLKDRLGYFQKSKEVDVSKINLDLGCTHSVETICAKNLNILKNPKFLQFLGNLITRTLAIQLKQNIEKSELVYQCVYLLNICQTFLLRNHHHTISKPPNKATVKSMELFSSKYLSQIIKAIPKKF